MNETIQTILSRRSIRKFKDTVVPGEIVNQIIECGLRAPSSKNAQPWRFHIIKDKILLEEIAETVNNPKALEDRPTDPKTGLPNEKYEATVKESSDVLKSAPIAIFIENTSPFMGGKREVIKSPYVEELIEGLQFELIGIGAAVENMLLAAHSLKLGAVFMGDLITEEGRIKNILGISGDFIGVIALGYPDETELWDKPLEENRVHHH